MKFDAVFIEKEETNGLSAREVIQMTKMLKVDDFYPLELEALTGNSVAMGFITSSAAKSIDFTYDGLRTAVANIMDNMNNEAPSGIYRLEGLSVYLSRNLPTEFLAEREVFILAEEFESDGIREFSIKHVSFDEASVRSAFNEAVETDSYGLIKRNGISDDSDEEKMHLLTNYDCGFVEYYVVKEKVSMENPVIKVMIDDGCVSDVLGCDLTAKLGIEVKIVDFSRHSGSSSLFEREWEYPENKLKFQIETCEEESEGSSMYYDVVCSIYEENGTNNCEDIRIDSHLLCGGFETEDEAMEYINNNDCNGDKNPLQKFETIVNEQWTKIRDSVPHIVENQTEDFFAEYMRGETTLKLNQWLLTFKDPAVYAKEIAEMYGYDENWCYCRKEEMKFEPIEGSEFSYLGKDYQFTKVTYKHSVCGVEWQEYLCTDSPYVIDDVWKSIRSYGWFGSWYDASTVGPMIDKSSAHMLACEYLKKLYTDTTELLFIERSGCYRILKCISFNKAAEIVLHNELRKEEVFKILEAEKTNPHFYVYSYEKRKELLAEDPEMLDWT